MKPDGTKNETEAIQFMIHQRLRTNAKVETLDEHPDDDSLCAFIEGRLDESGSTQIVSHLIVCSSCRHITAQVTRLDSEILDSQILDSPVNDSPLIDHYASPLDESEPGRLRSLLEGLASRVFPESQEDVVFAYQNPPDQEAVTESTADASSDTSSAAETNSKEKKNQT